MYYRQIIILICVNCLLALGAYMPLSTGLMVAYFGSLMGIGAIAAAAAHSIAGLPFPIAILIGGMIASICGAVVAYLCGRLNGFLFTVTTLGLGELIRVIVTNSDHLGGALGYRNVEFTSPTQYISYLLVALALCIAFFYTFERSGFRRALTAIRENELLTTALGINVSRHRAFSLASGGFLAGIAGGFYIHNIGILEPRMFGFENSLLILMYPIFGGSRSFLGPLSGAVLLTYIPETLRFSTTSRMILYGAILVTIIIIRPEGILGSTRSPKRLGPLRSDVFR